MFADLCAAVEPSLFSQSGIGFESNTTVEIEGLVRGGGLQLS
jgi:hypothetical protein